MVAPVPSRQLAAHIVEVLKREGHIVVALGASDQLLRDLEAHVAPVLPRILAGVADRVVMGEVTSTFGHEATDELVEELVDELRETLMESDGVEDVFADDRTIGRALFRAIAQEIGSLAEHAALEDDDAPPISVRLDTLGYVAKNAARGTDAGTLEDALERAARAADTELDRYDAGSGTAFFRGEEDEEMRLEIEKAIEEELSDLVDLGVVELPSVVRELRLSRAVPPGERKALRRALDALATQHLAAPLCPGTWEWADADATRPTASVRLVFTPLAAPDASVVDRLAAAFQRGLEARLAAGLEGDAAPLVPTGIDRLMRALSSAPPPPLERAKAVTKKSATSPATPKAKRAAPSPPEVVSAPARRIVKEADAAPASARPRRSTKADDAAPSSKAPRSKKKAD